MSASIPRIDGDRAPHAQLRRAIRLLELVRSGADSRPGAQRAEPKCQLRRGAERAGLEERDATAGRVIRSVRQWQDGDQGKHRPVRLRAGDHRVHARGQPRGGDDHERYAADPERELHAELRLHQSGPERRLRTAEQRKFRQPSGPPAYDPEVIDGNRPTNWETTAALDHEIVPGVSVSASYFRRWHQNLSFTENVAVRQATSTPIASRRRAIRGCPAVAATRSAGCTISSQRAGSSA